jgi:hypothetical protein
MNLNWKQIVPALLVGCLIGFWTGAFLAHRRHAPPSTEKMLSKFSKDLSLDAVQKDSLKAVLESYSGRFDALHEDAETRLSEIRGAMNGDIAKLLRPEQQKKFQEMQSHWGSRHKMKKGWK